MRHAPWLAPAAVAAAAAGGAVAVALVDPNEGGHYPTCPFLAVTGLWCPGCGTLRAVHALTHGDVATAVDLNALTVLLLPVLVLAWVGWLAFRVGRRPAPPRVPTWAGTTIAVAVPAFWVLRNLPVTAALAP